MCGIAGLLNLADAPVPDLGRRLGVMNHLIRHRGPDGEGFWRHASGRAGFAHRRLSIIDLSTGDQPMTDGEGNWITYNGETYNYLELREELGREQFKTTSDTEVILRAYRKWGEDCVSHLRGMFAFALWDERNQTLFCARDRFGIKPFYYTLVGDTFYFASEVKALLPFVERIETDLEGLRDYLAFQFCLAGKTLFNNVYELLPGHALRIRNGAVEVRRYWEVYYELDFDHTAKYFEERLRALLPESVGLHMRADVPVGTYLSGGLASSAVASPAATSSASPASSPSARTTTRAATRARWPSGAASASTRWTSPRRTSSRTSARSSTTSTTPWPAPAPSRSTWFRASRAATARSCSAARAATKSSAATPATSSPTSSSASRPPLDRKST